MSTFRGAVCRSVQGVLGQRIMSRSYNPIAIARCDDEMCKLSSTLRGQANRTVASHSADAEYIVGYCGVTQTAQAAAA